MEITGPTQLLSFLDITYGPAAICVVGLFDTIAESNQYEWTLDTSMSDNCIYFCHPRQPSNNSSFPIGWKQPKSDYFNQSIPFLSKHFASWNVLNAISSNLYDINLKGDSIISDTDDCAPRGNK